MDKLLDWLLETAKNLWRKPRFGRLIAVLPFVAFIALFVWWNWDHISQAPFVGQMVGEFDCIGSLPSHSEDKLTVALLPFLDDENSRLRRAIQYSLKDSEQITLQDVNCHIDADDEARGETEVEKLLHRSDYDVMLWGVALHAGGEAVRLYLTPRQSGGTTPTSAVNSPLQQSVPFNQGPLVIPINRVFHKVLDLAMTSAASAFIKSTHGQFVARQQIEQLIGKIDAVLQRPAGLTPIDQARLRILAAEALVTEAHETGEPAPLLKSIGYSRRSLPALTGDPLDYTTAENTLGNALDVLGEREPGTADLQQAVAAYKAALQVDTHDRMPLDWARTESDLGVSLYGLGERERGAADLQQAVTAYNAALQERTRDRVPLDWAETQNDLGNVLTVLGERESRTADLQQAVTAYKAALQERTRDRVPLDWAQTENNLGNVLAALGKRESETADLQQAVTAYKAALQERTRDRVPLKWATTEDNLGAALDNLGERESGTADLQQAVAAYNAALQEGTRDRSPVKWAQTQNSLGVALYDLGERESGTADLQQAVAAYQAAIEEYSREHYGVYGIRVQLNRARMLCKSRGGCA